MRVVLLSLTCVCVLACDAFAQGQQTWTPQTYTPQTFTPQTHAPSTHSTQTWTPITGDVTGSLRRRSVRCSIGNGESCTFIYERELRPGSPCTCGNGTRGSVN